MAQIYANDLAFTKVYPMKLKSNVPNTLSSFIHEVGIPHAIHSDNTPELEHGKFRQLRKDYRIMNTYTEPYSPWQNRAESGIRELKCQVHRKMVGRWVPQRLYGFCSKCCCKVRNKTAGKLFALNDRTPFEATLGNTPDISSLIPFDFCDAVWYIDENSQFPEPKCKIGRWLGEAQEVGQAMCYWLISETGTIIT